MPMPALIFDVDGTLAETEEGHRTAFNAVFAEAGVPWNWDRRVYRDLLAVSGGKERMAHYARKYDPARLVEIEPRLAELHVAKNGHYAAWVRASGGALRPGVRELVARSRARGQKLAIATTTSRANLAALLEAAFGAEAEALFPVRVVGEDVKAKKPDPEVYMIALSELGVGPEDAIAFEDSLNGLRAATAAGLRTVVTPSLYTSHENFAGAWRLLPDLTAFADADALGARG